MKVSRRRGDKGRGTIRAAGSIADVYKNEGGLRGTLHEVLNNFALGSSSSGSSCGCQSLNINGLSSVPRNFEPRCLMRRSSSLVCGRDGKQ